MRAACQVTIVAAIMVGAPLLEGRAQEATRQSLSIDSAIERLYAAYAAGDDQAVERWLPMFSPYWRDVEQLLVLPRPWERCRAAFLLEAAMAMPTLRPASIEALITAGRQTITSRPRSLGADHVEDRFEIIWHQMALAILLDRADVGGARRYLDTIMPRFDRARAAGVRVETRLPLAAATVEATFCCSPLVPGAFVRKVPGSLKRGASLESALALFQTAASHPALAAEAHIRGATLLYAAGRFDEALTWLGRIDSELDPTLTYTSQFTRARSLERTGAPAAEAAAAYEEARAVAPQDQLAGIGLAAALLRAGRSDEAVEVATAVRRRQSEPGTSPLTVLQRGDGRFLIEWLAEIRRSRR